MNLESTSKIKNCYGNYKLTPDCVANAKCNEVGCFNQTLVNYGACDCIYKERCHLTRQNVQSAFRLEYQVPVEECDFYRLIREKRIG